MRAPIASFWATRSHTLRSEAEDEFKSLCLEYPQFGYDVLSECYGLENLVAMEELTMYSSGSRRQAQEGSQRQDAPFDQQRSQACSPQQWRDVNKAYFLGLCYQMFGRLYPTATGFGLRSYGSSSSTVRSIAERSLRWIPVILYNSRNENGVLTRHLAASIVDGRPAVGARRLPPPLRGGRTWAWSSVGRKHDYTPRYN